MTVHTCLPLLSGSQLVATSPVLAITAKKKLKQEWREVDRRDLCQLSPALLTSRILTQLEAESVDEQRVELWVPRSEDVETDNCGGEE